MWRAYLVGNEARLEIISGDPDGCSSRIQTTWIFERDDGTTETVYQGHANGLIKLDEIVTGKGKLHANIRYTDNKRFVHNVKTNSLTVENTSSVFSLSNRSQRVIEEGREMTLTIQRKGDISTVRRVSVQGAGFGWNGAKEYEDFKFLQADGRDFRFSKKLVEFRPGEKIKYLKLSALKDQVNEGVEYLTVDIKAENDDDSISSSSLHIGIRNKYTSPSPPVPKSYFTLFAPSAIKEGDQIQVSIRRSGAIQNEGSVKLSVTPGSATVGHDVEVVENRVINFAKNQSIQTFNISTIDDDFVEGREWLKVGLSRSNILDIINGNRNPSLVWIEDNDSVDKPSGGELEKPRDLLTGSGSEPYELKQGNTVHVLRDKNGKTYSDQSSLIWDFTKAIEIDEGKYAVLLEGEGRYRGRFRIYSYSIDGAIESSTPYWLTASGIKSQEIGHFSGEDLFNAV